MEINFEKFRENLESLMESRGYSTGSSLAHDMGVTQAAVSRWRTSNRSPESSYIVMIAQFFGVSIDWLLGFETDKYNPLPQDQKELIRLYSLASQDDRNVIHAVLAKYKEV